MHILIISLGVSCGFLHQQFCLNLNKDLSFFIYAVVNWKNFNWVFHDINDALETNYKDFVMKRKGFAIVKWKDTFVLNKHEKLCISPRIPANNTRWRQRYFTLDSRNRNYYHHNIEHRTIVIRCRRKPLVSSRLTMAGCKCSYELAAAD